MSTVPPPPGPPPTAGAGTDAEDTIGLVPPPPGGFTGPDSGIDDEDDGKGGSGRVPLGLKIGFVVLALVLIAGAAFGAKILWENTLGGGGPQPADALPGSTVAYMRLDLDPSASQKIDLLDLLGEVPEAKEAFGLQDVDSQADLREVAFTQWFGLEDACDVDYDDDVKPWIGERVGFGYLNTIDWDGDEDEIALSAARSVVLAIQVSDEDKARDGITKLAKNCGLMDMSSDELGENFDEPGIVFRDGYALVTIDDEAADSLEAEFDDHGTLASDNDQFRADMDALGEDGVASVWTDSGAVTESMEEAFDGDVPSDFADEFGFYQAVQSTALTIRASDSTLEAAGVATLDRDLEIPKVDGAAGLPEATLAAFSLAGGGRYADEIVDGVGPFIELFTLFESGPDCFVPDSEDVSPDWDCSSVQSDPLDDFEDETGLQLPDDLATLLGDEFNVWLGSGGVDDLARAQDFEDALEASEGAIEITSDGDVIDVIEKLTDYLGVSLNVTETDTGAIISSNDDAADTIKDDDGLGQSDTFTEVIGDHDRPIATVFIDIETGLEIAQELGMPSDDAEDLDFLKAFGATAWLESDNVVGYSAKLSFNTAK